MVRSIRKVLYKFTRQKVLSPWLGGAKEMAMHTAFYVTIINFSLIAVTAYNTTLRDPLQEHFPWMSFPLFIGGLVILVLIAMVFEYKFIHPAVWAFRNKQQYSHDNPMRRDLEKIKKHLGIDKEEE